MFMQAWSLCIYILIALSLNTRFKISENYELKAFVDIHVGSRSVLHFCILLYILVKCVI